MKTAHRQPRGIRAVWSGTPGSNQRCSPWRDDAPATLSPLRLVDPRQDGGSCLPPSLAVQDASTLWPVARRATCASTAGRSCARARPSRPLGRGVCGPA
jgi:hypothetical protein